MDKSCSTNDDSYLYIVEKFGEEKVHSRYEWLYTLMEEFLRIKKYRTMRLFQVIF